MAGVAQIELVQSLEEGGFSRKAAERVASALDHGHRRETWPHSWMIAYAALLTALIIGGFGWLHTRIDTSDAKTTAQFTALDAKTTAQITALDDKISSLDAKTTAQITALDDKISALDAKTTAQITALDDKISALDAKVDETREEMVERFATIEAIINERLPSAPR